jgi:hypothetical protein
VLGKYHSESFDVKRHRNAVNDVITAGYDMDIQVTAKRFA